MSEMPPDLIAKALAAKGFMPPDEGALLHQVARERRPRHCPLLEVGTYCGKSTILLGAAAQAAGGTVFTVDHHRGCEEKQAGWEYHDTSLVDPRSGLMDTLPLFRATLAAAGLEEYVVAVVGRNTTVAATGADPAGLVFIDGGHTDEHAGHDYTGFARWVAPGGSLVIHDVFADPAEGGQPPYRVYRRALASGDLRRRPRPGLDARANPRGGRGRRPGHLTPSGRGSRIPGRSPRSGWAASGRA